MGGPAWVFGFSADVACAVVIAHIEIPSASQPKTTSYYLQNCQSSNSGPCFFSIPTVMINLEMVTTFSCLQQGQ